MRTSTLIPLLLVMACGPAECQRSHTEAGSSSRPQAARLANEYLPKPDSNSDERPWASAFANYTLITAGAGGTRDPRALSWLSYGVPLRRPAVGAVAVLDYGNGRGHVAFVEGTYNGMIVLLGGDQSNAVNKTAFAPGEITAYRWPAGQPMDESAYELPTVRPDGAPDDDAPRETRTNTAAAAVATDSAGSATYYELAGQQPLRVEALADGRIRFQLQAQGCRRNVAGTAYEIYPSDMQIDAENGVGYPDREYFFWADREGERGLSIRLSVGAGPRRARVIEWGYDTECPYSGAVMHASARPR